VQVIVEQITAILQVLALGEHVGRDQDVDLPVAARNIRTIVGVWRKRLDQVHPVARVRAAVDAPDDGIPRSRAPRAIAIVGQRPVEVTRGVLVVGEDEHLLPRQLPLEQRLERGQLVVLCPGDVAHLVPDVGELLDIARQVAVQPAPVVLLRVQPRQALDDGPRFGGLIDSLGLRARNWGVAIARGLGVFLIGHHQPHCSLKRGRVQDDALLHVLVEGLDKLQGAADGDAERVDARFQPLEEPALEDADQRLLPAQLELILLLLLPLVRLQVVMRQVQRLDIAHDLTVQPLVRALQVVAHGAQPPLGPTDALTGDGRLGIGPADELARAPDDDLFQQVEDAHAALLDRFAPRGQEKLVQVADVCARKIGPVVARDQVDLVVQIENVVVDGRSGQQDQLLAAAAPPAAPVERQQPLEGRVARGAPVAEVVRLVYQHDIHVGQAAQVEIVLPQLLLREHHGRDGCGLQLVLPHGAQRCGTDHERLLALVVCEILEQLLADPRLAQPDRISDEHAIVARQDTPRLLDRVLLKLRKLHGRAGCGGLHGLTSQVIAEVLEERLHIDFVRGVLPAAELRVFQDLDQPFLEILGQPPLIVVPVHQVQDGARADFALK